MLGPGRGQSEIVGTLFLTAVVIALVTAVGVTFLGNLESTDSPSIDIVPSADTSEVRLGHNGGATVNRSDVTVHLEGSQGWTDEFRLNDTTVEGDGDDEYDPGDTAVRSHAIEGGWVDIMVVHEATGTVLLRATEDVRERTPVPGTPSVLFTESGPTPTATPPPTDEPGELTASFTYSPSAPLPGQSVSFDASDSEDTGEGDSITSYEWDWTSDGTFDATGETATHTYLTSGTYTVTLRVTDEDGNEEETSETVSVSEAWTMYQVDAENLGRSDNVAPTANLAANWTVATGTFDSSGVIVGGNTVYGGTKDGNLTAWDAGDGSVQWIYQASGQVKSTPVLADGTLYVPFKQEKKLRAVYADNGTERWTSSAIGDVDRSSVTVANGVVYLGDKNGVVHAIYAANGTKAWKTNLGQEIKSTPAVRGGTVYVADKKGQSIYAISASDGSSEWSFSMDGEPEFSSPTVTDDSVYVGDRSGTVYAIDRSTGTERWQTDLGEEVKSSLSVMAGTVFAAEKKSGVVHALNASSGQGVWNYSTADEVEFAGPSVAGGAVYVSDKAGTVYALSAGSGEEIDTYATGAEIKSPLAVADGVVYVGDTDGSLHAISGDTPPVADFRYSPSSPVEEEVVRFNASWSTDPDSSISSYEWDFDDDGLFEQTGRIGIHEFDDSGDYQVSLRVTSGDGGTDTRTRTVTVDPTIFEDETSTADLGSSPGGGTIVFADFDGDGYLDVFMNDNDYSSEEVRLRKNDHDNTFSDFDDRIAVDGGRGAGTGDFDNDGDADLVVGTGQKLNENTGDFEFDGTTVGSENNEEALMFVDIDGDGDLDIWSPGEDYLWHENTESGWDSHTDMPGDPTDRTANGEGATAADINDDGYVDFLFAEDGSDVDAWINDGDYSYSYEWNVDGAFGLPEDVDDHENMEWAWGDYDADGDLDVYISGHDSEGLYRNDGTGSFTEVSSVVGISESDPDGAAWGDYDNDGHLDLLLADSDGDGTFTEVDASANLDADGALGSTMGWFDADNDGDLDIVTNQPTTFWNNTQDDGEYLRVMVEGSGTYGGSPVTPIGAQIDLYKATGERVGHRELIASQNQLQPPFRQHFGVNTSARYDIRVRFPSGQVVWKNDTVPDQTSVTVGGTTLDQTVRIEESGPLLADDFNRPDSADLDWGWEETEPSDSSAARITGSRLDFQPENLGERPVVEHTFADQTAGTITLSFVMNFERTASEQWYSTNIQLGDNDEMVDPQDDHDSGVGVNLKWGGNEADGVSDMDDEEGFGYTLDDSDTQIGVVSGQDGDNSGGDATVTVTVDLDAQTYDISVTGPGLVEGSGTASDVPFDNDVPINSIRIFLDEVAGGNFDDLEIDDLEIEKTS